MPSAYIADLDLPAYGVPSATAAQVTAASTLVDSYLKRPEGLQWKPDAAGLPCYMAGLTPVITLKCQQAISAGTNIVVPITTTSGVMTVSGSVGDVVILDRAAAGAVEACVISSVTPTGIVLQSVANAHTAPFTIDFGLVISEQRTLPAKRAVTRVSAWPIARMMSIAGSYRYGRRSQQNSGLYCDQNLMSITQVFGGPPEWTLVEVTQADFDPTSGEVWIPSGIYATNFSDVRMRFVAGFSQANIPPIIKQATATAITAGLATADLVGGIKMARAGASALEKFSDSIVDADLRQQLDLFRARLFV